MELKENLPTEIVETSTEKATTENTTKSIFISGIPYTSTEDEIKLLFEKCGKIKSMKVPKYQDTGRNLGYAHIVFQNKKGVEKVKYKKIFFYLKN